ncbi:MAG: hypothetical protein QOD93_355 [Acetobacteraceae bacterium]|nr:hypothetical protein [Acetobacteraceae bacterium]
MELVIPDGAQVQITVGHPQFVALPHDPRPLTTAPVRTSGRILKGLAAGLLLMVAFQAGRLLPHRADTASATQPSPADAEAPSKPGTGPAADVPPAFRAQIAQPPQVIQPPGAARPGVNAVPAGAPAPPAGTPAAPNAFGLQG